MEEEQRIYSFHGTANYADGRGVSIIAPLGTGKITHSWGLLFTGTTRLIADYLYFVRLSSRESLAFGSENNCYMKLILARFGMRSNGSLARHDSTKKAEELLMCGDWEKRRRDSDCDYEKDNPARI